MSDPDIKRENSSWYVFKLIKSISEDHDEKYYSVPSALNFPGSS